MVAEVVGHWLTGVESVGDPGMGHIPGHNQRASQSQASLDRVAAQLGPDLGHRPIQVNGDYYAGQVLFGHLGQEPGRVVFEFFQEQALLGDLTQGLPVRRAGHGNPDRVGGGVAGQAHHPYVVAEVLATELGADPELPGHGQDPLLPLRVPEAMAGLAARCRQVVQIAGRGVLGDLQVLLGRRTAYDHGQVVRRAGCGA